MFDGVYDVHNFPWLDGRGCVGVGAPEMLVRASGTTAILPGWTSIRTATSACAFMDSNANTYEVNARLISIALDLRFLFK